MRSAECRRPAKWCDVDHIVSWLDGGPTSLDNLQLLCRFHHRLKHLKAGQPPPRQQAKRCAAQPQEGPRRQ
ncbi:MAG: HNH endonuclease signature motif containing protein [Acidimicrobiia bacterium]